MITKLSYSNIAQKSLFVFTLFIFSTCAFSQNEFITTWKTDNPGTSNSTSITIPTIGAGYSYDVDWDNDGTFDEFGLTGNVTHDFTSAGTYTIRIQGAFPRIYFNNEGDKDKIISIDQWGNIAWASMENAFFGTSNLMGNAADAPDLTGVTSMRFMFYLAAIFDQDISAWDTSTVTNMSFLFGDSAFNNGGQPLSWNTSMVSDMSWMFNITTVFNQDISAWNTSNVTNFLGMFSRAQAFNQDISGWNTAMVTNMSSMFNGAWVFNQDISAWDTSKVTGMGSMFVGTAAFNNGGQPLTWNTSAVTFMLNMFWGAGGFNQDISSWDTSSVTNMSGMFSYNTFFNQDISAWDVSNVTDFSDMFLINAVFNNGGQPLNWNTLAATDLSFMFFNATAFNQDLSGWNLNNVTNLQDMFNGASLYNNGGQPLNWTTTGVTSFNLLFSGATAFNQDISSWDTSNVTNMSFMFFGASSYNNGGQPLNWNTSSVTNMARMFWLASPFNQDISSWNVESVTDFSLMFTGTVFNNGGQPLSWSTPAATNMWAMLNSSTFNQDISTFNTSLVVFMIGMFNGNTAFNQDISGWDVSSVVFMNDMFSGTTAFNNAGQPLNWNTANVTSMSKMFLNATAFDQDIGGWNVESVTDFTRMFEGAELSNANYDALLIGWDAQNLKSGEVFDGGNSQYCTMAAQTARAHMEALGGHSWNITDGGLFSGTCGVLGIEDNELGSILLYPNPVKDVVELMLTNNQSTVKLNLYNITGQLIYSKSPSVINNRVSLDLSQINTGIYFLSVTTNQGFTSTKQLIKK